jgi:predicted ATPase/DNA-binding winged helix-turn-helix (wHTH) protein
LNEDIATRLRPDEALAFGPFRLVSSQKCLREDGRLVRLGSRAMDLLLVLVERAGSVVSHDELVERVWPSTIVEESSLRVHVAALRKALGDGRDDRRYIANVPGRGYCFVGSVERLGGQAAEPAVNKGYKIPPRLTQMIGRADDVRLLCATLHEDRLVTIAGPGGIGKTTVAAAVTEDVLAQYRDGVAFVDLAPVADSRLLASTVASVLGLPEPAQEPLRSLAASLRGQQLLIVLDNCEHLAQAAAMLVQTILAASHEARVLVTSREPLDVEGERVHRLGPLETPPASVELSVAQAMTYPAIHLFVQRASAIDETFALAQSDVPLAASLCRQLDGIPLAIEFAAARVDTLGLKSLADRVEGRLNLLTRGRRTALPRHRTLRAVLDWSFDLLEPAEQRVLRRLAVFRTGFPLESAGAVAGDEATSPAEVARIVLNLAQKSLVTVDAGGESIRYRLLETTRLYATEKLADADESRRTAARHAQHMLDLLDRGESDWQTMDRVGWNARYGPLVDDVRAALDWCFSQHGDIGVGVRLTAAALLLVYELGLLDEYHERVDRALDHVHGLSPPDPAAELWLNVALVFPGGGSEKPSRPYARVCERSLQIAEQLSEPKYRIAALHSVWVQHFRAGDYPAALAAAERVSVLARSADIPALLLSERITAQTRHFLGQHEVARTLAERVCHHPVQQMPRGYISPVPPAVAMRIVIARALWLQGLADQARDVADACVRIAASHPFALTQALALAACPVAIWRGDEPQARELVERLLNHTSRLGSAYWQSWAVAYAAALDVRDSRQGTFERQRGIDAMARAASRKALDNAETFASIAPSAALVARVESGTVGWCAAEVFRLKAEALQENGAPPGEAEAKLDRCLRVARAQGELSWELRGAISLASVWSRHGRIDEARALLAGTYGRFTEGFSTHDLLRARRQLESLS